MNEPGGQRSGQVPEALRRHVETNFTREQIVAANGCDQETVSVTV